IEAWINANPENHRFVQRMKIVWDVPAAVTEGKVSLRREANDAAQGVVITKGQMSILPEDGSPSEPLLVDVKKHLGWMHNEVLFEDTPLHGFFLNTDGMDKTDLH
ncbi:MAG: hypothetical protein ACE5IR_21470, partial [bacterium]